MQRLLLFVVMTLVLVFADNEPDITGNLDYQSDRGLIGNLDIKKDFYKGENDDRVTGSASVSKVLVGPGFAEDPTLRGSIAYQHDRGSFSGGVRYQPGSGATANVGANYDIYRSDNRDARLNIAADASRGISGPASDFKPNYGAYIKFERKF